MNERPRLPKPTKEQLRRLYKKTPFDREEKTRITFDFDKAKNHRERQELQSREKIYRHRWKEEQELRARQERRSKKWQPEHNKQKETWRDVYYGDGKRASKPMLTI